MGHGVDGEGEEDQGDGPNGGELGAGQFGVQEHVLDGEHVEVHGGEHEYLQGGEHRGGCDEQDDEELHGWGVVDGECGETHGAW